MKSERPRVSVFLLTYNHSKYIIQALESVLNQDFDEMIEVFICDDCSTDDNRDVVIRYKNQNPERCKNVHFRFNEKNIGWLKTTQNAWPTLRGEYVIHLDGDDYWMKDKIRKQVAILDANPQYAGCASNSLMVYEGGDQKPHPMRDDSGAKRAYNIYDIIESNYFHTTAVLYRNIFGANPPPEYFMKVRGDYTVTLIYANKGDIAYIPETLSVYRQHATGDWTTRKAIEQRIWNFKHRMELSRLFGGKYSQPLIRSAIWDLWGISQSGKEAGVSLWKRVKFALLGRWYCLRYFGAFLSKHRSRVKLPSYFLSALSR